MCGRVEYGSSSETAKRLGVKDSDTPREGDNNAFPYKGTFLFGLADRAPDTLRHFHWPLVPSSCTEYPTYNTSNARSEDMHTKSSYQPLLGKRHCIIAVEGFYEWERKGNKTPYYFSMADGSIMRYAGLWDYNTKLDAPILSCTIITREPNEIIGEVHDRMPVFLTPEVFDEWLAPTKLSTVEERETVVAKLEEVSGEVASTITKYEVDRRVNNSRKASPEDAKLIEPVRG